MIQKIRQFVKGGKRTLLSAKTANEVVRPLNALLNMRIQRGANDSVMISDSGVVITLARSGVGSGGSDGGTSDALTTQHPSVGTAGDLVNRIVINSDDEVFIAGTFQTVDGIRRQGIAAFSEVLALRTVDWFLSEGNVAGSATTYAADTTFVNDLIAGPSNTLYICGSNFAYVNNTRRGYSNCAVYPPLPVGVAQIDQAAGNVSAGFAPAPAYAAGSPGTIVVTDSGLLVFGIDDWDVGTDLGGVIRLLAVNGNRDLTFGTAAGFDVIPSGALHVGSDLVYCVGSFTSYGATTRNGILRLLGSTLDASFEPVSGFNGAANVIVSDGGSSFIVGGDFTTYDGTAAVRLAKINGSAELDETWTASANGAVSALCVQADGKVLVGGSFTQINDTARSRLARLNSDGTLDTGFDCSVNEGVAAIAVQSGGQIVIGGSFTTVGGATRNRLARLSATGTVL